MKNKIKTKAASAQPAPDCRTKVDADAIATKLGDLFLKNKSKWLSLADLLAIPELAKYKKSKKEYEADLLSRLSRWSHWSRAVSNGTSYSSSPRKEVVTAELKLDEFYRPEAYDLLTAALKILHKRRYILIECRDFEDEHIAEFDFFCNGGVRVSASQFVRSIKCFSDPKGALAIRKALDAFRTRINAQKPVGEVLATPVVIGEDESSKSNQNQ